jgi:hypothetical protein
LPQGSSSVGTQARENGADPQNCIAVALSPIDEKFRVMRSRKTHATMRVEKFSGFQAEKPGIQR